MVARETSNLEAVGSSPTWSVFASSQPFFASFFFFGKSSVITALKLALKFLMTSRSKWKAAGVGKIFSRPYLPGMSQKRSTNALLIGFQDSNYSTELSELKTFTYFVHPLLNDRE
jgi:hypothetical protein